MNDTKCKSSRGRLKSLLSGLGLNRSMMNGERVKSAWGFLWCRESGRPGLTWLIVLGLSLLLAPAVLSLPWGPVLPSQSLGLVLLIALVLATVYRSWFCAGGPAPGRLSGKDLALLGSLLVILGLAAGAYALFAEALARRVLALSSQSLAFAAPLCAAPLLAALFLGARTAMVLTVVSSFVVSLMWADESGVFAYYLITGLAAVAAWQGGRTRSTLIRAGLRSGLVGLVVVTALALYRGWILSAGFLAAAPSVVLGGLMGGVLAAGLVPMVEMALGYTTDIRIMELGNLDHPILQELTQKAPGTYHHSLVVSSLAESAAREIGANHLLARVAALYHDIGKIKKPDYFIENQKGGPNRHEKLAPSMSALILTSHVKEGVELARKHRLGKSIIDIMAQHHGTRTIRYFYAKAVEEREKAGQAPPKEENFQYPGPKPQTKEAGLIMLADTVEAASRTLVSPTTSRVRKLVQTQINKVFAEGQLDECELTLKDLHGIAKSFNNILSGIFHQRVEYPEAKPKDSRQDGDNDRQPPNGAGPGPGGVEEKTHGNLRRLGMLH